jgi:GLPGLI family protein
MKLRFISLIIITFVSQYLIAQSSNLYSVKYIFEWQREPINKKAISKEIMELDIKKDSTIYFSLSYQIETLELYKELETTGQLRIDATNSDISSYPKESEIIYFLNKKKEAVFSNKFSSAFTFHYIEKQDKPVWTILQDTMSVLKFVCQKATTIYRGRNYTAWFTTKIPYSEGPWLLKGLPGLILKVSDSTEQIKFECLELSKSPFIVMTPHKKSKLVKKGKVANLRKLLATDISSFDEIIFPSVVARDQNGNIVKNPRSPIKPYNPIDLSEK